MISPAVVTPIDKLAAILRFDVSTGLILQ